MLYKIQKKSREIRGKKGIFYRNKEIKFINSIL